MFSDSFLKSNPPILWRIAPLADFIVTVGVSGAGLGGPRDSRWLTLPLSEKSSLTDSATVLPLVPGPPGSSDHGDPHISPGWPWQTLVCS